MSEPEPFVDHIEDVRDDRLNDCPVKPLGHCDGVFFFLSPIGELQAMKHNEFTINGLGSLFLGDEAWLHKHFGRTDSKGNPIDGFNSTDASFFLMRACRDEGMFDKAIPIRGPGVWRTGGYDDRHTGIIVHSGDVLLIDGKWQPAGSKIGGAIYPATPRTPPVSEKPATFEDGRFLHETISMNWNFKNHTLDAILVTGFIAQAMLGAAPRWRTHMMVNGEAGSGKSYLADTVAGALGGAAHPITNNFTEAGLRQSLTGESRCLVLDEAEHTDGGGRVAAVIELIRHMSGGGGSRALRGSSGGKATGFSVTGCAYLSSIIGVPLSPQDKSRFVQVGLNPLVASGPEKLEELECRMGQLRKMSPALRRRMVDSWPRFVAHFESYRTAFMSLGLNSRNGDTIATLFAGKEVMMRDGDPIWDVIQEDLELARPLLMQVEEDKEDGEGQQCLNHLYSALTDSIRNGNKQSLGQMIIEEMDMNRTSGQVIGAWGLRWEPSRGEEKGKLIIANRSVGLEKIFTGTRWGSSAWTQALSFIGAQKTGTTHRFGGAPSRGYLIPEEFWPRENG